MYVGRVACEGCPTFFVLTPASLPHIRTYSAKSQGVASKGYVGRSGGLPTEKRKFISFLKPYEVENQSFDFLKAGNSLNF